uniref:RNA polymerase sigma factor RpoD/SigA n=1 Tax=candidate division WOR-3 bacterium TaxID=2052148 RepID=A0A7C6ABC6_UNCW3
MSPIRPFVDDKTVTAYLKDVLKIPLLTPEQEQELARRARKGDEVARNQLINANLRLVINIAKSYIGQGLSFADLINEGNVGLIEAVRRFDERRGVKLSTYATWSIRYKIVTALANRRLIKFPLSDRLLIKKVRDTYLKIYNKYGKEPSIDELATELKVKPEAIARAFLLEPKEFSLNGTDSGEPSLGGQELLEEASLPSPEDIYKKGELRQEIRKVLNTLSDREREVIEKYFGIKNGIPRSLSQIGREWGVSREMVRQVKKRALKKLKGKIEEKELQEILGKGI